MRLHRKTVALDRATVVRLLFHMRLFRQQFTIQIYIFRSHDYLVASDRAPIVKGPLINHIPNNSAVSKYWPTSTPSGHFSFIFFLIPPFKVSWTAYIPIVKIYLKSGRGIKTKIE